MQKPLRPQSFHAQSGMKAATRVIKGILVAALVRGSPVLKTSMRALARSVPIPIATSQTWD